MENKIMWILIVLVGISIIVWIGGIVGTAQGLTTKNQCEEYCEEQEAITFQRFHNGEWNLKDPCVCYYSDRIETIILNE